jgi:hypothetical protein
MNKIIKEPHKTPNARFQSAVTDLMVKGFHMLSPDLIGRRSPDNFQYSNICAIKVVSSLDIDAIRNTLSLVLRSTPLPLSFLGCSDLVPLI